MRNFLSARSGFTLVEALVNMAMLAIVIAAISAFVEYNNQLKFKQDLLVAIINYRAGIISSLRSSDALVNSASGNTCLSQRMGCPVGGTSYVPFSVFDANAVRLTDATAASYGWGVNLKTCTTFPSKNCPIRYDVQWKSVCAGAACSASQVKVLGTLTLAPSLNIPISPEKYNFEITLGQIIGNYQQSCTSIGGSYVAGSPPACNLPMTGSCPPNEMVTSVSPATKTKVCKPVFPSSLSGPVAANSVIVGVNPNGTLNVRPIVPTANQIAGAVPAGSCVVITDPGCPPLVQQLLPVGTVPPAAANPGAPDGGLDGGCGGGGDGC